MKSLFNKSLLLSLMLLTGSVLANPVWIDVRTEQEYQADHIEGDAQIDYRVIVDGVSKAHPDKNTQIRLYCRSGRRAGIAKNLLEQAGYRDVQNIGSIGHARQLRAK